MSKFSTGVETLATLAKKSQGSSFSRTNFFSLDDGEEVVVRFLTDYDDVISVTQHMGAATRPRPDWLSKEANWSPSWGCVCRNTLMGDGVTKLWEVMDDAEAMPGCYVCDNVKVAGGKHDGKPDRAKPRGWALVCIRKEILGDGSDALGGPARKGQVVSYVDSTIEVVDRDGKTSEEKDIRVVNMGHKNFFSLLSGTHRRYGTLLDRDFAIKRVGEGLDTTYEIVHLDPIPNHDLRDPAIMATYPHEPLDEIVMGQAEAAYQRRFFDPTYTPPQKADAAAKGDEGAPVQEQAKASGDVDAEHLAAMAAKIQGHRHTDAPADDADSGNMVKLTEGS